MIQRYFNGTAIRVIEKSNELYFIAKDVCEILGIRTDTIPIILDDEDYSNTNSIGVKVGDSNRGMTAISEPGLYELIFKSRKKEAIAFRRWVTKEVLPSLRKTGKYEIQSEDDIQQKIVKTLSYSKHPLAQEQWEVNRNGDNIRFDLVHRNCRHVHVFELKNHKLSGNDILHKIYEKDYHGAILNLAGKRKASFWFIANEVDDSAKTMLKALSKEGVKYGAMGTIEFYRWARHLVGRDFPGFEWYYNNLLDGQLVLEAV